MALHALGSVDPLGLVDARLQFHHAAQFAAAFAQSVFAPRDDDSHRTLHWDGKEERFYSEPTEEGLRAFVAADPLAIGLQQDDTELASLQLMGATLKTAKAWMEKAVQDATDDDSFSLSWPEFDLPDHFVMTGRPFQAKSGSLVELAHWYSGAQAQLNAIVSAEADAEPVLTWPHHFDIASLLVVSRDDGAATQTVGVGMSPGDGGIPQPYWYVNVWGQRPDAEIAELESPGHTHRDGWSGFVLTATELIEAGREGRADPAGEGDRQTAALNDFLDRAISAAKAVLAG